MSHLFNTTQVVLALATNQKGLPIGYELFEGNKAEVSTLAAAIESWKKNAALTNNESKRHTMKKYL